MPCPRLATSSPVGEAYVRRPSPTVTEIPCGFQPSASYFLGHSPQMTSRAWGGWGGAGSVRPHVSAVRPSANSVAVSGVVQKQGTPGPGRQAPGLLTAL